MDLDEPGTLVLDKSKSLSFWDAAPGDNRKRVMEISRILLGKKRGGVVPQKSWIRVAQGCYHRTPGLTAARWVCLWSS